MPSAHSEAGRFPLLAGILLLIVLFAAAVAYGISGDRPAEALATTHCLHHHPDHHGSLPGGTGHHFNSHQNHEWWRGYGNVFSYSDAEHVCS